MKAECRIAKYGHSKEKRNDAKLIVLTLVINLEGFTAQSQEDQKIIIRRCSEPSENLLALYSALRYKPFPFTKLKSVVHKSEFQKNDSRKYLGFRRFSCNVGLIFPSYKNNSISLKLKIKKADF